VFTLLTGKVVDRLIINALCEYDHYLQPE